MFDMFEYFKTGTPPTIENIVQNIYATATPEHGPWIAGGMPRTLVLDNTATEFADIDVWFKCPEQLETCRLHLLNVYKSYIYESWISDNALTYNIGEHKVQLVRHRYFDSVQAVFDYFDFTCCQIALDKNGKPYGPGIQDAKDYVLRVNKIVNDAFLARYAKYIGYGYVMNNEDFLNVINNQDINYEFDGPTVSY